MQLSSGKCLLQILFLGLVTIVVSVTLSIFVFELKNSQSDDMIPIKINIFGDKIPNNVQDEINNSITTSVEKAYEKSISRLNVSIMLFSCALGIFTIVFGFFYFLKIRESERLMEEMKNKTDEFFRKYHREQYNKNVSDLFSDNNIKRYNALKNISNNPEITIDDFDVIKTALFREFEYKRNAFVYGNINSIINILIYIDNGRTMRTLIDLLKSKDYDHMKMYQILQYVVVDELDNTKNFIKNHLEENTFLGVQLVSALIQYGVMDEYSEFILELGADTVLQQFITMAGNDVWKVNLSLNSIMKRISLPAYILGIIIHNKTFPTNEKMTVLLHFYSKDTDESNDSNIALIITMIKDDENAKKEFLELVNKYHIEKKIMYFFQENKHYLDYFKDMPLANAYLNLSTSENEDADNLLIRYGIKIEENGKIVDDCGKEYIPDEYIPTLLGLQKAILCITIDNKKIPVSDIKKLLSKEDSSGAHTQP
jgi:uncharacterized protein YxeA